MLKRLFRGSQGNPEPSASSINVYAPLLNQALVTLVLNAQADSTPSYDHVVAQERRAQWVDRQRAFAELWNSTLLSSLGACLDTLKEKPPADPRLNTIHKSTINAIQATIEEARSTLEMELIVYQMKDEGDSNLELQLMREYGEVRTRSFKASKQVDSSSEELGREMYKIRQKHPHLFKELRLDPSLVQIIFTGE
jgi:hypothetical protein